MNTLVAEQMIQEAAADVGLIVRDLQKLTKVLSLYPPDNPLPIKMRGSVSRQFLDLVERLGGLKFEIRQEEIIFGSEVVYKDRSREEALADVFYRSGIVILDFQSGLTENELSRFFDSLRTYAHEPILERDLVTLLWQEQFEHVRFTTVEDLSIRDSDPDLLVEELRREYLTSSGDTPAIEYGAIVLDLEEKEKSSTDEESAVSTGPSEQEATADQKKQFDLLINESFSLTQEERRLITRLIQENRYFDPQRTVSRILLETLQIWDDVSLFSETAGIGEKILDEFLAAGAFAAAADFVHSLRGLRESLKTTQPPSAARLDELLRRAGDKKRIERLTEIINQQEKVDTGAIEIYLESLGWESLASIADTLGRLVSKSARLMVCDYLARHGRDRLTIIGSGVRDRRWYVVRNSVMILGRIGGEQILPYLEDAGHHPDRRVRAETIRVLAELGGDAAVEQLCRFLDDPDSELRLVCLKHLEKAGGRTAFESLWKIISSDAFEKYSLEEQQWFLIAFSRLGGEEVVDFLAHIVGALPLLGSVHSVRFRLAALTALVHNHSEEAERVILKFTCSWRKWLRQSAAAALEQRRKLLYGGESDDRS